MANPTRSAAWTALHAAIARCCKAWGDGSDHHRACINEIRDDPDADLAEYIALFDASAAAAEKARAEGRVA